jgi:hypothetical protein
MDDTLKGQVIDTIHDIYICEMRNKYTGYLGITTSDILDRLLDCYGIITPADLEVCKTKMNAPIDSTQMIGIFFQRIDDCINYADDGKVPFTPEQTLQTVSTSGYYADACTIWRKKPAEAKTWASFKQFFAEEYHDLKEQQKVNTSQTNFHSATAVTDISSALDNLAFAATTDRDIVTQLAASNKQLVETNKILTEQLQKAMDNNSLLLKKLSSTSSIKPTTNTASKTVSYAAATSGTQRKPFDYAAWTANLDPNGYCWTHG